MPDRPAPPYRPERRDHGAPTSERGRPANEATTLHREMAIVALPERALVITPAAVPFTRWAP